MTIRRGRLTYTAALVLLLGCDDRVSLDVPVGDAASLDALPLADAPSAALDALGQGDVSGNDVAFDAAPADPLQPDPFADAGANVFADSAPIRNAYAFVRDKMRNSNGGVRTNYLDVSTIDDYLLGWNVTAEHMGLMLWASAAVDDRQVFEESYQFVVQKLQSPRWGIVDYAYFFHLDRPYDQAGSDGVLRRVNAPLDDMRIARGLIEGWMLWGDERYKETAMKIGYGLIETSISAPDDLPAYPLGLVGPGAYYLDTETTTTATVFKIPVNYADLWTMEWFASYDPRWQPIIDSSVRMMKDAQLPNGQFHCVYLQDSATFDGGWEYRDPPMGQKIVAIQSLWTAIHLARSRYSSAVDAARRALAFYESFYNANNRIPHFLNPDGTIPTEIEFSQDPPPTDADAATLAAWGSFGGAIQNGEARVYSLAADLAYILGDPAFADRLVAEKILTDQDDDPTSPLFGNIGVRTADTGDADAFNSLESILALSFQQKASALTKQTNLQPIAPLN